MNKEFKTKKQNIKFKLIIPVLGCVAFLSSARAVSPTPDGCYPNSTTAEGCKALQSLTSGVANTGVGWYSLFAVNTGSYNTALGAGALDLNTADNNTAVGVAALLLNTTGTNNTAIGTGALVFNNTGEGNTATGAFALYSNTDGQFNTADGEYTLYFNTIGERNTAIGDSALYQNTEGSRNTAVGNPALLNNATGSNNTAVGADVLFSSNGDDNTGIGADALSDNTNGIANTAVGRNALSANTTGSENTALGTGALFNNIDGSFNTATGRTALISNISGTHNTANGYNALRLNASGSDNTAIGETALFQNSSGGQNTALGEGAGFAQTTGSNNVYIGLGVPGVPGENNACYIASIFNQTSSGGAQVLINSNNKLGTIVSSKRFKDDIQPMDSASQAVFSLNPVKFRYKKEIDSTGTAQFGLVAEDVEQVNPDLVVRDKEGKPYSVRYDQVNAMLLNEFLKEHRTVQTQQKEIDDLKQELNEQRALIEKVTERMNKVEPQRVADAL